MQEVKNPKTFIIAEAGINHGGNIKTAEEMVKVAADAGVDAIKFQSFTAKGLTHETLAADQHEFFLRFEMTRDEHEQLAQLCKKFNLNFLSTPFDFAMADMLNEIGVPAFKIASCDLTNIPLITHCARFGKPLYISTGMANLTEVKEAINAATSVGNHSVTILQCTTNYPTKHEDVNIYAMTHMRDELDCNVGFSDHSIGNYACFAAVALGAAVIEKHFCLDKNIEGPDIPGSCDPDELKDLVRGIRSIELSLGDADKTMRESEVEISKIARRSIFYANDLDRGHKITTLDLLFLRPAGGLSPAKSSQILAKQLKRPVKAGEIVSMDHLED